MSVDSTDATLAPIQRDSEGVFEIIMTFAAPFNEPGWHDMRFALVDAAQHPLSGFVEIQYFVAGGAEAGGGVAALPDQREC